MVAPRAYSALLVLFIGAFPTRHGAENPPYNAPAPSRTLDLLAFRPVEGPSSGPAVYYHVAETQEGTLLRADYKPGLETVAMGIEIPEQFRQKIRRIRWSWRARTFPVGGDECLPGRGDSAASVRLAFKRGLKWYILKYVWTTQSPLGAVCDRKRTLLLARDTIVLESGGRPGTWLREVVDVRRAFIDHFADGDPEADVPDFVGVAVMTDGDQTRSESAADYTAFEIVF